MAIEVVLIRWNEPEKLTYEVLNLNAQLESPEVVGLSPELEYLVKRTPFAIPKYDTRLVNLVITQGVKDEIDEEFPPLRKWEKVFVLQERTVEDKMESVIESENSAALDLFPTSQQARYLLLYSIIVRREALGLSITAEQQKVLDDMEAKGLLMWQNYLTSISKREAIIAEVTVDLDSDWEKESIDLDRIVVLPDEGGEKEILLSK